MEWTFPRARAHTHRHTHDHGLALLHPIAENRPPPPLGHHNQRQSAPFAGPRRKRFRFRRRTLCRTDRRSSGAAEELSCATAEQQGLEGGIREQDEVPPTGRPAQLRSQVAPEGVEGTVQHLIIRTSSPNGHPGDSMVCRQFGLCLWSLEPVRGRNPSTDIHCMDWMESTRTYTNLRAFKSSGQQLTALLSTVEATCVVALY